MLKRGRGMRPAAIVSAECIQKTTFYSLYIHVPVLATPSLMPCRGDELQGAEMMPL